ncbi:MAG: hypothetical protein JNK58_06520 [Phycisphaerae bacterium]|nr:hypothetical protein [Phycisphaerae bacterium]
MPRFSTFNARRLGASAAFALLAHLAADLRAQSWGLSPATAVALPTRANYNLNCTGGPIPPCCSEVTACGPVIGPFGAFSDLLGWNRWWESIALCKDDLGDCGFMKARGEAVVRLRGLGSSSVLVRWDALAYTKERCDNAPGLYVGDGRAAIIASISFTIDGSTPGAPLTVYFRWKQASSNSYSPESGAEDSPTSVVGGSLTVSNNGVPDPQFDTEFDLVDMKGGRFGPDVYGSFATTVGSTITIDTDVALRSTIRDAAIPVPGSWGHEQCRSEFDRELVSWSGEIELSLGSPVTPPIGSWDDGGSGGAEPTPDMLFSVDIGGDTELSDPAPDGNEVFDPGDAYPWMGPPLPFAGADGPLDDAGMFGGGAFDPIPNPGVPFANDACLNTVPPASKFFDLDDFDRTEIALSSMITPGSPLPVPIVRFATDYIHRLEYSVISFEDDGPERFVYSLGPPYCSTPVGSPSNGLASFAYTHGKSSAEDEIEQVRWTPGVVLPYLVGTTSPGLDEMSIHTNLAPNPDASDASDDDVDGLDLIPAGSPTDGLYTYFTADHEATGPIAGGGAFGGTVYQRSPAGIISPLIAPAIHLGLPATVDLRALEFVWLAEGAAPESLAMIFSVAPNDPGTVGIDESAGLDPRLLYYSYLTGAYGELISTPFDSPVDAFSNYRRPLLADAVLPPSACPGDANADGIVNFSDVTSVLANFGSDYSPGTGLGDADHNGPVNFGDVTSVLANFGSGCP